MDIISVRVDELLICLRAPAEPAQGFWEKQLLIQTSRIIWISHREKSHMGPGLNISCFAGFVW